MIWTNPPLAVLGLLVVIALGLALVAPLYVLLFFDLLLTLLPARWEVAGVLLDPTDIVFGALVVGATLRMRRGPEASRIRIPYLGLWLLLGCLISLSYLRAPDSQQYLTGPLEIAYQLYRYCWKDLLYYPLAVVLLSQFGRTRRLILVVVVVGVLLAIQAIPGGYTGSRGGPILSGNGLGMALHAPLFSCLALIVFSRSRRYTLLTVASLVLIVRASTFSGSRGAFVADMVGIAVLCGLLAATPALRPRLARLGVAAALLTAGVFLFKPDVLERPTVSRLLTVTEGTASPTFEWRREERWSHFWEKALDNPWLGVGTDVDPTLGSSANTPHNGYLSIAVSRGFPALAIILCFSWLGVREGVRFFRNADQPVGNLFGLICALSLVALLVHNVVDNGFGMALTTKIFWMFTGLAVAGARQRFGAEDTVLKPVTGGLLLPVSTAGAGRQR